MKDYRSIFYSYKECYSGEFLTIEAAEDFIATDNRNAIKIALEIGEVIYKYEDIAFHTIIIYDTTNPKMYEEICTIDFNSCDVYENN